MNRPDSRHLTTSTISLSGSCMAAEELLIGLKAPEFDFEIPVRVEVLLIRSFQSSQQNSPRKLLQLDESASRTFSNDLWQVIP